MELEHTNSIMIITIQILRKAVRRVIGVFKNHSGYNRKLSYLLEYNDNTCNLAISSRFSISIIAHPPVEAYMFFPVGKRPASKDSICFVAYEDNLVAGWSWIHYGARQDIVKNQKLNVPTAVTWFGPDFVRPKYRGHSLQRQLIRARLDYVYSIVPHGTRIMTLISANNKPSLHSYMQMGFNRVNLSD